MVWLDSQSPINGRHAIIGLGGLYILLATVWAVRRLLIGHPTEVAIFDFLMIGVPATVLPFGGYRLKDSTIKPGLYARIFWWSLSGPGVLLGIVVLIELNPGGELGQPFFSLLLAAELGSVAGFLIGLNEARAITRAEEAERATQELEATVSELQRTNDRLDDFAKVISHDLQSPLTVAQGHLDLAKTNPAEEHIEPAERALDRMGSMIEDLLTMSQQGQTVDEVETIDLAELAEECWRTVPAGGARLTIDTEQRIRADRSRTRELLENLFRNAIEHSDEAVTITVGELDDETGFFIMDDGPGIPEGEREAVFESGYSTSEIGTGFGLAIVQEIVSAHDWEIDVTTSEDGGTRFEITEVTLNR